MSAATARGDAFRQPLLAKVHIAKKELGLDDDTWRDLIEQLFGTRSVRALSTTQLSKLVEELKHRGFQSGRGVSRENKTRADAPNAGVVAKLRAQWLSLYNLGVVTDPKDSAIEAFVQRQTKASNAGAGVAKLNWLPAGNAYRAIEALKDWATREGVNWELSKDPRDCVLAAQAAKCVAVGVFQYETQISARAYELFGGTQYWALARPEKDRLIQILGSAIRAAMMKRRT